MNKLANSASQPTIKPLPVGTENFAKLIENNCYYIDKTAMIKDLIDDKSEVFLFTRPRRFGKTLNMSMLRYFFEINSTENHRLFDGLYISQHADYMQFAGRYPVISVTLKGVEGLTYEQAFYSFRAIVAEEYSSHSELAKSSVLSDEKIKQFNDFCNNTASPRLYAGALKFLIELLHTHYQQRVIVLIDEYDVPLNAARLKGYYTEMLALIKAWFEPLKTNDYLERTIITGCLRISRESIFTGFNNLKIYSILDAQFSDYFGFTQDEVTALYSYYGKEAIKHIWNILYFTGYLTLAREYPEGIDRSGMLLKLPNAEAREIYEDKILNWFDALSFSSDKSAFIKAFKEQDCDTLQTEISNCCLRQYRTWTTTRRTTRAFSRAFLCAYRSGRCAPTANLARDAPT